MKVDMPFNKETKLNLFSMLFLPNTIKEKFKKYAGISNVLIQRNYFILYIHHIKNWKQLLEYSGILFFGHVLFLKIDYFTIEKKNQFKKFLSSKEITKYLKIFIYFV